MSLVVRSFVCLLRSTSRRPFDVNQTRTSPRSVSVSLTSVSPEFITCLSVCVCARAASAVRQENARRHETRPIDAGASARLCEHSIPTSCPIDNDHVVILFIFIILSTSDTQVEKLMNCCATNGVSSTGRGHARSFIIVRVARVEQDTSGNDGRISRRHRIR
jgi:hypothetical protein